jgi:hypothetical protein
LGFLAFSSYITCDPMWYVTTTSRAEFAKKSDLQQLTKPNQKANRS